MHLKPFGVKRLPEIYTDENLLSKSQKILETNNYYPRYDLEEYQKENLK